jgi:hypothetical protein
MWQSIAQDMLLRIHVGSIASACGASAINNNDVHEGWKLHGESILTPKYSIQKKSVDSRRVSCVVSSCRPSLKSAARTIDAFGFEHQGMTIYVVSKSDTCSECQEQTFLEKPQVYVIVFFSFSS